MVYLGFIWLELKLTQLGFKQTNTYFKMSLVILIYKGCFSCFVVGTTKPYFVFQGAMLVPPIWGISNDILALILYFSFKLFSCYLSFSLLPPWFLLYKINSSPKKACISKWFKKVYIFCADASFRIAVIYLCGTLYVGNQKSILPLLGVLLFSVSLYTQVHMIGNFGERSELSKVIQQIQPWLLYLFSFCSS